RLPEETRARYDLSSHRFARLSHRVLVAPEVFGAPDDVPFPWRIEVDGAVFAVDLLRSLSADHLLEQTGRAPADAVRRARQALHAIT
ncbi:MAG TPA: hypothetical protein PKA98_05225, partial [Acidimicrobiales bacterium]|nr:hypothetical protein [Acidimicrobiales bacterium]